MKPLIVYFIIAYLVSWLIWLPLYGHIFRLHDLPVFAFNHALGGLGPLLAAFITTLIFSGKQGLRLLLQRSIQVKPFIYFAIALLAPFFLALLASLIVFISDRAPLHLAALLTNKEFPEWSLLSFFLYNLVFFGFGEEVGWRGFALPRLQAKSHMLMATIILALLWALWHWPLFFYRPGYVTMGWAGILGWFFSLLTGAILLTWLYNVSRGSIFICAIFHSTIDIAFTADFATGKMVNYLGFLITVWGIATAFLLGSRNRFDKNS